MAVLITLACAGAAPGHPPVPTLQLVETWPVETSLDQPDIADANDLWVKEIGLAKTTLDIAQFYVSPNPDAVDRMDPVLSAVAAAATRGVKVRILADAKFNKTYPDDLARLGGMKNIEVAIYDMKPITGGVMHAKYFIVDGERGYLGSQNFDWRSLEHIQELGVWFTGPNAVTGLSTVFSQDWALATGAATVEPNAPSTEVMSWRGEDVTVRFVASPKGLVHPDTWDLPHLLRAIDGAKSSIRLQLLSYAVVGYDKSPWRDLDNALRAAAGRGVAVRILVSNWQKSKRKQVVVKALTAVDGVEIRFVNIPEHSSGWQDYSRTVHSKYLVVDGQTSWVGTSNWSKDYFHSSRNVGLMVEGHSFAKRLEELHRALWSSEYAEPVDPAKDYLAPYEERKATAE